MAQVSSLMIHLSDAGNLDSGLPDLDAIVELVKVLKGKGKDRGSVGNAVLLKIPNHC